MAPEPGGTQGATLLPSMESVFATVPFGSPNRKMARRGGAAAARAPGRTMASRNGSATLAPAERSSVRRGMCQVDLIGSPLRQWQRVGFGGRGDITESVARGDVRDQLEEAV